ncbi:MAG: hypothetical protein KIH69_000845 [Anaerolineae bacterium]|nr:hypothetical protein [Anaerolineae bacterium]
MQKIVLWWHYVWIVMIVSAVLHALGLASIARLLAVIGFIVIATLVHKAYRTLDHKWMTSALGLLSVGIMLAVYFDKLEQVLTTALILIIVMCIFFIIWMVMLMIRSFYAKDETTS